MRVVLLNKSRSDKKTASAPVEYPIVVAEIAKFDPKPVDSVVVSELLELEEEKDVVVWADERLCEIVSTLCVYGHMLPRKYRKRFEQLCEEAKELCGE